MFFIDRINYPTSKMKHKKNVVLLVLLYFSSVTWAQLGLKAGVNVSNEIQSLSASELMAGYNSQNLTGYQIGLVYQLMPSKSGIGMEIGALINQKGSAYRVDSTSVNSPALEGYREIYYLEVPLNVRYRISLGTLGLYGFCGGFCGYALNAKSVNETNTTSEIISLGGFKKRLDFGYNLGAGIEFFKKIQLGGTWSQGFKTTANPSDELLLMPVNRKNKVVSVNLVYLF